MVPAMYTFSDGKLLSMLLYQPKDSPFIEASDDAVGRGSAAEEHPLEEVARGEQ